MIQSIKSTQRIDHQSFDIAVADGVMNCWRFTPSGSGTLPVVVVLMDAPGLRRALHDLAETIAAEGYVVWMPNLYYRLGRDISVGPTRDHPEATENRDRMLGYVHSLTNRMVVDDVSRLLDWLPNDKRWNGGMVGLTGYCMSGRYAMLTALARPDRVAAAASYFGTRLVTDEADSPHRLLGDTKAELYFAFAENDHYAPPETITALSTSLRGTSARYEIDTYPGTAHGFVFPDRGTFHVDGARRHWSSLFNLLKRNLKSQS